MRRSMIFPREIITFQCSVQPLIDCFRARVRNQTELYTLCRSVEFRPADFRTRTGHYTDAAHRSGSQKADQTNASARPYQAGNLHPVATFAFAPVERLVGAAHQRHRVFLQHRHRNRDTDADRHSLPRSTAYLLHRTA